jgi:hypothetical protein
MSAIIHASGYRKCQKIGKGGGRHGSGDQGRICYAQGIILYGWLGCRQTTGYAPALLMPGVLARMLTLRAHPCFFRGTRFAMLTLNGFFDSQDRFVPDEPVPILRHKKATITIEEEDGLALIPSGAWNTFFRELEAIEGEDIPDDFIEQFRMSNFRTPEELALL